MVLIVESCACNAHHCIKVQGNRINEKYQTPGVTQSAAVQVQPISLAQVSFSQLRIEVCSNSFFKVQTVVQKCLMRES
jgi:hypothetical protein